MCQDQFDILNWTGTNGHYIAMGSDVHRLEVEGKGNVLAAYYNDINTGWNTRTGSKGADLIHTYVNDRFTSHGSPPAWLVLNEISASQWPQNASYRTYLHDMMHKLRNTYGYEIILCSPFPNPGYHNSDWQAISENAYIGIEQYLSGEEILNNGSAVSWCQNQYQGSKKSYINRGISASRLFLVEHFGQTLSGTAWGRAGVSREAWDNAIKVRSQAACNVGFAGFVSYAWAKNKMEASDDDLKHFEDTYRRQPLPLSTSGFYVPPVPSNQNKEKK
jgi:hypothetical protein